MTWLSHIPVELVTCCAVTPVQQSTIFHVWIFRKFQRMNGSVASAGFTRWVLALVGIALVERLHIKWCRLRYGFKLLVNQCCTKVNIRV